MKSSQSSERSPVENRQLTKSNISSQDEAALIQRFVRGVLIAIREMVLTKGNARTWKLFSRLRVFVFSLSMVSAFVPEHAQESERFPVAGGGPAVPPDACCLVQQIRDGLFWVSDGAYNTMLLVTAEGVIAIDAPPTLGETYLKAIAANTCGRKNT